MRVPFHRRGVWDQLEEHVAPLSLFKKKYLATTERLALSANFEAGWRGILDLEAKHRRLVN